jgi:hypothetical protein
MRDGGWESSEGGDEKWPKHGRSMLTSTSLLSARDLALGKAFFLNLKIHFAECPRFGSVKYTLPSALWLALDKDCFIFYITLLPSALDQPLGKELCVECLPKALGKECLHFFLFFKKLLWCFPTLCTYMFSFGTIIKVFAITIRFCSFN